MPRPVRSWDVGEAIRFRQAFLDAQSQGLPIPPDEQWTVPALARRYGVSIETIRRGIEPERAEYVRASQLRWAMRGECPRCGKKGVRRLSGGRQSLCKPCSIIERTAARDDTLRCARCREWKPDAEFTRATRQTRRRQRGYICRDCRCVRPRKETTKEVVAVAQAPVLDEHHTAEDVERWLKENGVHRYERVAVLPISQIDKKESHNNQARINEPVNFDRVQLIAEAMKAHPDEIPPIVVWRMPSGKYKILDGNHRHAAAELNHMTALAAYVITEPLSENQQRMLAYTANLKHGWPPSIDERVQYAVWLIEERDMKQAEAARELMLPPQRVAKAMEIVRAAKRSEALGIRKEAMKIPITARGRLTAIRNDNVFKEAVTVVSQSRLSIDDVNQLVKDVNAVNTEAEQMAAVNSLKQRTRPRVTATAGGRVKIPKTITDFESVLARFERLNVDAIAATKIDGAAKADLFKRVETAIAGLGKIYMAMNPSQSA